MVENINVTNTVIETHIDSLTFYNYQKILLITYVSNLQGIVEIPYLIAQTIIFGATTFFMIHYEWNFGIISPSPCVCFLINISIALFLIYPLFS